MNKVMIPELVVMIFDKFNKSYQKSPWMWSVDNQSF